MAAKKKASGAASAAAAAAKRGNGTGTAAADGTTSSSSSPSATAANDPPKSIVFFHPDLGIGGAERLVVDAAVGLQERGHRVVIFTNHCDPGHSFDECHNGTLDVRVRGAWLIPMSIASRLTIVCAILRHIHLLLHIFLSGELRALKPDAFVVDQLSAGLPLMRCLAPRVPILFYCHFPDLLLARGRASLLKRLYRVPFDYIEEWSMGFAQAVAVNSLFTRGIVDSTWPGLKTVVQTVVVYPCVDTESKQGESREETGNVLEGGERVILSINRFEEKKDIGLAIKAFAAIPESERRDVRLVLAGGYDPRVAENVQYHTELQQLATSLDLAHHTITPRSTTTTALAGVPPDAEVLFLLSVPNSLKTALLNSARLLVYTPSNEHFGIVPLEAMLARVPVLAANTGGPVETVVDGQTGWLRAPDDVPAWTDVMRRALDLSEADALKMGEVGASRVKGVFGRDNMAKTLDDIVTAIGGLTLPPTGKLFVRLILTITLPFFLGIAIAKGREAIGWSVTAPLRS